MEPDAKERLLEDALRLHDEVQAPMWNYARQHRAHDYQAYFASRIDIARLRDECPALYAQILDGRSERATLCRMLELFRAQRQQDLSADEATRQFHAHVRQLYVPPPPTRSNNA